MLGILIGTDSNAHSTVWNCPKTDKQGEFIEVMFYIGNSPTFENA